MPDAVVAPDSVREIDEVEDEELSELEHRVGRLREHERAVADELSEFLDPIRDWVLQTTRDERFADRVLLGQLAILWLEVEDAVGRESQDDFEMAIAMIDEAIRRADRRSAREAFDESPPKAIGFVLTTSQELSSRELAELFGLKERTVREWRRAIPTRPQVEHERLSTLAQVLFDLIPSTTGRGAFRWFQRPLFQLDGQRPIDLLNEGTPESYEKLRAIARATRGQGA